VLDSPNKFLDLLSSRLGLRQIDGFLNDARDA